MVEAKPSSQNSNPARNARGVWKYKPSILKIGSEQFQSVAVSLLGLLGLGPSLARLKTAFTEVDNAPQMSASAKCRGLNQTQPNPATSAARAQPPQETPHDR